MTRSTYAVTWMTSAQCVGAVSSELTGLGGVHDVAVDPASGRVTVTHDRPLADPQVRAGVAEAGYELAAGPTPRARPFRPPACAPDPSWKGEP